MNKGKLIVIDGGDGAGKKTQTQLLVSRLKEEGREVVSIEFPQYEKNTFGQLIKECLSGDRGDFLNLDPRIASTLYAADRYESMGWLETQLKDGKIIILDRYVSSNMLHQGGKLTDPAERKSFLGWLDNMEHEVFGLPRPDLIVYCSVDYRKRMELLSNEAEQTSIATDVAENDLFHQQQTDQAAEQFVAEINNWQTIECMDGGEMRTREAIHEDIYNAVKAIQ